MSNDVQIPMVDRVLSLERSEVQVLYGRCRDLTHDQIALKYGKTSATWSRNLMTSVFEKLGSKKTDSRNKKQEFLRTQVCPVLDEILKGDEKKLELWPLYGWVVVFREGDNVSYREREEHERIIPDVREDPPQPEDPYFPSMSEEVDEFTEPEGEEEGQEEETSSEENETEPIPPTPAVLDIPTPDPAPAGNIDWKPPTAQPLNRLLFIVPVLICIFCLFTAWTTVRRIFALFDNDPNDPVPTPLPVIPEATNTFVPVPTFFTSTPSLTSSPTETLTHTPTPMATVPSPTSTLPPPDTLTPLPPALFEANFDSGFPAGMEFARENVDIVDGKLVAHEYTLLGFGDGTWNNYQVEYEASKHTYCWGLQNNGVAAHAIDPENMIMWSWNYCETGWFELVNGDWVTITAGRDITANPGTTVKIRLVAENGNFTVYVNDFKKASYFNEKYTEGKAYILVTDSSIIDNIRISHLR